MYIIIKKKKLKLIIADNFFLRLTGLMFKKNINYCLLFPKCNSIHTMFMKENIDILGINNHNKVIYKYENLPKNKIIIINNKRKDTSIIELPKNTIKNIKINDFIEIKK